VYSLVPKAADKISGETFLSTGSPGFASIFLQARAKRSDAMSDTNDAHSKDGGTVQAAMKMYVYARPHKFSAAELAVLRTDLQQTWTDHFQAAEMVTSFLIGRGYGVCRQKAREAVARMETANCAIEFMQSELDRLALVM
jgi:hypothetical protein